MVERNLTSCEDIPKDKFSCFRWRYKVLVVGRDGALNQLFLKDSSWVALTESYFISDKVKMSDQIITGLENEMIFVKNMNVENHIVF